MQIFHLTTYKNRLHYGFVVSSERISVISLSISYPEPKKRKVGFLNTAFPRARQCSQVTVKHMTLTDLSVSLASCEGLAARSPNNNASSQPIVQ